MAEQPKSFWWAIASAGAMVVGGFGPWARVLGVISVSGTDGDGWIVIVAALVAAGLIFLQQRRRMGIWPFVVALLAAVIASVTTIYDWTDLNHVADQTGLIHAGWGIYLATSGSVSLALACVGLLVEAPRMTEAPPPASTQGSE
jgi:hypothetical protein